MNYTKRFTIIFISFLFYLPLAFSTAHAKTGQTFEVDVDWLNIRSSPTVTGDVVGILKRGNKVTIFQEKHGWVQTYFNGEEAWVASKHLLPIELEEKETFFHDGLLSAFTIVIDPGHGGKDPGAIGQNGVLEKDLILKTSLKVAEKLEEIGANVILTRVDDSFVSLNDRVLISSQQDTDAFISIHFNAFTEDYVGGFSTFYNRSGKQLASNVQAALAEELALRNRGISQGHFTVLQNSKHPAILIELGFITNTQEVATLQTESYQDKVARAITTALIDYFWN